MPIEKRFTDKPDEVKRHRLRGAAGDFDNATERSLAAERREQALQLRLSAAEQRIDDGVGRDWSADLLDYSRTPMSAAEFKPTESVAAERNHQIPGTSGIRLNILASKGD